MVFAVFHPVAVTVATSVLLWLARPARSAVAPRNSIHNPLAPRSDDPVTSLAQCFPTSLQVHNKGYEERCGQYSDADHPCFTHWSQDLSYVQARPWYEPFDITQRLLVKDEGMLDFTMTDPDESFIITYLNGGNTQLIYSDWQAVPACYNITLRRGDSSKWRIWVSDEYGKDRDLDTKHYVETSKQFCHAKWLHIHVKRDG